MAVEWRYDSPNGGVEWQPYSVVGGPIERLLVALGGSIEMLTIPSSRPGGSTCHYRLVSA